MRRTKSLCSDERLPIRYLLRNFQPNRSNFLIHFASLHFYQEELKDVTRKQKKAKEDKKFWDDVEIVGGVAVPLVTGLISYLATGKSDKSTFNAGLSSAAWTALNKKARKETEDFSREINEAKRHSEHFQTLKRTWKTSGKIEII